MVNDGGHGDEEVEMEMQERRQGDKGMEMEMKMRPAVQRRDSCMGESV